MDTASRWSVPLAFAGALAASALLSRRGRLVIAAGIAGATGVKYLLRESVQPLAKGGPVELKPQPQIETSTVSAPLPAVAAAVISPDPVPLIWEAGSVVESVGASFAETVWFGAGHVVPVNPMPLPVNEETPVLPETFFIQDPDAGDSNDAPVPQLIAEDFPSLPKIAEAAAELHFPANSAPEPGLPDIQARGPTDSLPSPRKSGEPPRMMAVPLLPDEERDDGMICDDEVTPAILLHGGSTLHRSVLPVAPTEDAANHRWPLVAAALVMILFAIALLAGMIPGLSWFKESRAVAVHAGAKADDVKR